MINVLHYHPHTPAEKDVKIAAYFVWEKNGKPEGRDLEFWFKGKNKLIDSYNRNLSILKSQEPPYKKY